MGNNKFKIRVAATVLAVGLVLGLCGRKQVVETQQHMAPTLGGNDNEKVTIKSSGSAFTVTRVSRKAGHDGTKATDNATVVSDLGEARNATFTVEKDGSVKVWVQTKGFCFRPGVANLFYGRPRLALDVEWAFFRRNRIDAGISVSNLVQPRLYVAGGYNFWSNSSLLVGIDSSKTAFVGYRLGF